MVGDGSIREVYYDYNNDVIENKRNWLRRWREVIFFWGVRERIFKRDGIWNGFEG